MESSRTRIKSECGNKFGNGHNTGTGRKYGEGRLPRIAPTEHEKTYESIDIVIRISYPVPMNDSQETAHEHHRRSIRLRGYDYSENGAYFVTICTRNREHLFGEIKNEEMRLNDAGRMIDRWWYELGNRFPDIELDAFVVMPNHIHGIIVIKNLPVPDPVRAILSNRPEPAPDCVRAIPCNRPEPESNPDFNPNPNTNTGTEEMWKRKREQGDYSESPVRMQKMRIRKIPNTYDGLGRYISWFKRMTANEYIRRVKTEEFPRFEKSIWHRNYYESIIRDDGEWNAFQEYIEKNPEMWNEDELNSRRITID